MNPETRTAIRKLIVGMPRDELNEVFEMVRDEMRTQSRALVHEFHVGQRVSFSGRGRTFVGKVVDVNRSTVNVVCDSGERWKVSPTLLHAEAA